MVLYERERQDETVILIIGVDDRIIATSNAGVLKKVKAILTGQFIMKDLGNWKHFLGVDFKKTEGQVVMSQKRYVKKILERF